ncbi:MAG: YaaR family protein [Firmicutes bacterium]|jgi:uncharacterized protein YaaR (DUF327 family)|nr:YaaR family protein [Bacillota bacterium]
MKIEPSKRRPTTKESRSPGRKAAIRPAPFAQELREASREEGEDLDELLAKVDELAERLIQAPSLELLEEYKTAVGSFLQRVLARAHRLEERGFIDVRGRRRIFMLLRCVDERLADLAESFVRRQGKGLALVAMLDEIRGLLLDLYF